MKSNVKITGSKKEGFIISVKDEFSSDDLAVTTKELEKIIFQGRLMLEEKNEN